MEYSQTLDGMETQQNGMETDNSPGSTQVEASVETWLLSSVRF